MLEILKLSFWSWARSSSWLGGEPREGRSCHRGHPIEAAVLVPRSRQLRGGEREGCGERPVRGHVEDPAVSAVGWHHLGVEGCGWLTTQLVLKDQTVRRVLWLFLPRVQCCICLLWHLWPSRYAENGQEGPSESLDRVNHRCKFDLPFFPTTSPAWVLIWTNRDQNLAFDFDLFFWV